MEYRYGRRKEFQVGEFLERRGWRWAVARASRGPADIVAERGRTRIAIQVKATRSDFVSYGRLRADPESHLRLHASRASAQPILALVSRNHVWLLSVPDQRLLSSGSLRRLRHVYRDA